MFLHQKAGGWQAIGGGSVADSLQADSTHRLAAVTLKSQAMQSDGEAVFPKSI